MTRSYLLLVVALFLSCSREALIDDFSFPTVPSQASIFCLLTPGDSIVAAVRAVQTINTQSANGTRPVNGSQIMLFDQSTGKQTKLTPLSQPGLYGCSQLQMPVLPGHRYRLLAVMPSKDTLQAYCQLPQQAARIDSIAFGERYKDTFSNRRRVTLSWKDVSEADKTCRYFIVSQYMFEDNLLVNAYFDQPVITQMGQRLYFINDVIDSKLPLTFYVMTAEPTLFTFYALAQQMRDISGSGASDFFGGYTGITPTYTNIQNGYGIFGGYLKTQRQLTFP